MNTKDILSGGGLKPWADMGEVDPQREGTYRRGYHQAIAQVSHLLKSGTELTAASLSDWVEGDGMTWRKDSPLNRQILAPALHKPA